MKGHCHCLAVQWEYDLPLESVTACNCTLCSRYGALWAYGQLGQGVQIKGPTSSYTRGSQINGFHFCQTCGCLAYYLARNKDQEGKYRIAVNMRMIDDPKVIQDLPVDHFEGKESFQDLPSDGRQVRHLWF